MQVFKRGTEEVIGEIASVLDLDTFLAIRDRDAEQEEYEEGADAIEALWTVKGGGSTDRASALRLWERMTNTQRHTTLEEFALYNAGGSVALGWE